VGTIKLSLKIKFFYKKSSYQNNKKTDYW